MLLKDRVVLVTGSGRGIGRAIAHRSAAEGAAVFLCARSEAELTSAAAEIGKAGDVGFAVADLTKEEDCARVVAAVHASAAFLLSKLVLPEMYARGSGVILNISSLSAKSAFAWGSAYAAAKAGMLGLTRVTAAEAARKGVRVNAICPGPVTETQMSKDLGAVLAEKMGVTPEKQLAGFLDAVLQGRGQTADEIAAAALFLCSDHASAITGQSLNVDGGTAFY